MTVVFQGTKSGLTANNDSKARTYSVTYKLHADAGETASVVGNNSNLPSIGSIHAEDAMAYCNGLNVKQVAGKNAWEATATWTTANSIDGEQGQSEDPEQDRPVITWNGSTQNISIYKDRDSNGIQNSAGDPLLDVMDVNLMGVTVASNVTGVPSYILGYRNSINSAAITVGGLSISAGAARLVFPGGFISAAKTRGDNTYYTFTYELLFDEQEKWKGQLLDQGYRQKYTEAGVTDGQRNILNDDLTLITEPAQLDGLGEKLENITPESSVYIAVNKYFEKDFTVLPGVTS